MLTGVKKLIDDRKYKVKSGMLEKLVSMRSTLVFLVAKKVSISKYKCLSSWELSMSMQ